MAGSGIFALSFESKATFNHAFIFYEDSGTLQHIHEVFVSHFNDKGKLKLIASFDRLNLQQRDIYPDNVNWTLVETPGPFAVDVDDSVDMADNPLILSASTNISVGFPDSGTPNSPNPILFEGPGTIRIVQAARYHLKMEYPNRWHSAAMSGFSGYFEPLIWRIVEV